MNKIIPRSIDLPVLCKNYEMDFDPTFSVFSIELSLYLQ